VRSPRLPFYFVLGIILLTGGCRKDEHIARFTVAQPDRESLRLLGAIVPYKDQYLFFKLTGPAAEVAQEKKPFDDFIASIHFDDKQEPPVLWKVPAGWKQEEGAGMRLLSFRIPAVPKEMELSVIPLPREGNGILENVNRWRKQLTLPPLERENLPEAAQRIKIDGQDAYLIDMTGLGVHTLAKAAAAPRRPAPAVQRPRAHDLPFDYDVPEGWHPDARPAGLSVASFTIKDGDKKASVTLTPLGGGAGGWADNINRWRGQVELPKLGEDELAKQVATLQIAGQAARYVDVDNPKSGAANSRILGAIVPLPPQTWFFKMTGPSDLVGRHKAEFESFVKSVKLGEKE
jgi:hypothetical protein